MAGLLALALSSDEDITMTNGNKGTGYHVDLAAGNDNMMALGMSPTCVTATITVWATVITDVHASYSNYDIFPPGQYVMSSWIGGTTHTNNISGTSMATPHIPGLITYIIGLNRMDNITI
ncbi:hypothetical protein EDD85DRAFT_794130 [Armillaria nabsnona]|nr:hypothetical protein EDD85DRAFT_794130 [Armillaria nabsnona]